MRRQITVKISETAEPDVALRSQRAQPTGMRRALLWLLYALLAAIFVGGLLPVLRWWFALPLGILLAAGLVALPDYYPRSKR